MSKDSVDDWSETASANTDIGGIDIAEGCAPGNLNNMGRAMMAQLKTRFKRGQPKFIDGLTLSNSGGDATNDITIAAGSASSDDTLPVIMSLGSAITKQLDVAWAVGNNAGGLDTGSVTNTTYHVWLIERSDTGVVDALFSTSATSPTMPANYDRKRRIGSIIRASGANKAFTQSGNKFYMHTFTQEASSGTGFGKSLITLPAGIPNGISVDAIMTIYASTGTVQNSDTLINVYDGNAPSSANGVMLTCQQKNPVSGQSYTNSATGIVRTDTSRRVYADLTFNVSGGVGLFYTSGWIDYTL